LINSETPKENVNKEESTLDPTPVKLEHINFFKDAEEQASQLKKTKLVEDEKKT